ncbi:MAG: hypothetical protein WCE61_00345 [Candidatus Acidiferrum sp.]
MHQTIVERFNEPSIIFLTVCTKDRKCILARADVVALLCDSWRQAESWMVGRFIIMPDHLHLFCAPEVVERPLGQWVRYWKTLASCRLAAPGGTASLATRFLGHPVAAPNPLRREVGIRAPKPGARRIGGRARGLATSRRTAQIALVIPTR